MKLTRSQLMKPLEAASHSQFLTIQTGLSTNDFFLFYCPENVKSVLSEQQSETQSPKG